jgi:release factor glutamine methyltransferase
VNLKIKDIKSIFTTQLSEVYPSEEIESFFTILSEYFLNYTRLETVLNADESLSEEIIENFENAISRLKRQEPIQYICGKTEFYSLPFKVDEHTLIPRPETEELVQWIIDDMNNECRESQTLLDIGTGSGCIAIALAKNLQDLKVSALDFSPEALEMAHKNSVLNGVKVIFFELDILNTQKLPQQYDIIVSNPPYIPSRVIGELQPEIHGYEPMAALDGNDDGLGCFNTIIGSAHHYLQPGGVLLLEIGHDQQEAVRRIAFDCGRYGNFGSNKDYAGHDRVVWMYKKN